MRFNPHSNGVFKLWLNSEGPVEEEVVAAGHLRQGKTPSMVAMMLGFGMLEVLRRRTKLLPRQFVLAVTPSEVVVFKAGSKGGGAESSTPFHVDMDEEVAARFPRSSVSLTGLDEGEASKSATMTLEGETFPVSRGALGRDPNTDELLAVLAGGSPSHTTSGRPEQNAPA